MGEIPVVSKDCVAGKVVLIRVDHNVVKKGRIDDNYRIERSKKTIQFVIENGGYPVLMTHIGRPRDKKTGDISVSDEESVSPVVEYIKEKWGYPTKVIDVDMSKATEKGLPGLGDITADIEALKTGKVRILYMPNTRWFSGEEEKEGEAKDKFTDQLASIADIFVNDAFGSHQAHVSTYWITKKLPSFAGFLIEEEIKGLKRLLELPEGKRPFLTIVAGAKIDTKIGALESRRELSDKLLVGGLPAIALICSKYGVKVRGIEQSEIETARNLLEKDNEENKLLIPDLVVVSDAECSKENPRQEGSYREVDLSKVNAGDDLGYIYDISPRYFEKEEVADAVKASKTVFTNAVVGFDKAGFKEGTVALYTKLSEIEADLSFGGGDTLKALKKYTPEFYRSLKSDGKSTLFTGGGTILTGFESRGVKEMKVIKALIDNGGKQPA
ncbi:phosphoglycerate kinase [Candidatus Woesearchaeota archaeon]|nr:phosphoglycerate kinase [Candidatus Woesearchaeota archaeon]